MAQVLNFCVMMNFFFEGGVEISCEETEVHVDPICFSKLN